MTLIEKILANHANLTSVKPGDIVDIDIDVRLARDFGGANVVKNLQDNGLRLADPKKTFFTFDCNPTGSDQKYAANQQLCRQYAREERVGVYDINSGIGTHLAIDKGMATPGSTVVSTDSHANILGAIGAFGQGMGDRDIAAAWARGAVWFKVPESAKIELTGRRPSNISAKDIVLNLLHHFGANSLLGLSVELVGKVADQLTLDERVTISSMATEMGAIAIFFSPSDKVIEYTKERCSRPVSPVFADEDAEYKLIEKIDVSEFYQAIALPGKPHDVVPVTEVQGTKIDSVFIGSCTNGRMEDMRTVARILNGKKVAPGIVLKIVPSTDEIWNACMEEGLIKIFKESGALLGNAGCAGCASGQIGQNGPGEKTVSTGNRNFEGKQGKGEVYLSSPAVAAASAVAGHITTPEALPADPSVFKPSSELKYQIKVREEKEEEKPMVLEGKVWLVDEDNIDTDMIFHNRYLAITDISQMGQYTFDNLKGWEDYASKSEHGDIVITGKNFGAGSSRQQAVDCFKSLGNLCILAKSFGAIYERNAINAGFPILTYNDLSELDLENRDTIRIDLQKGRITNLRNNKNLMIHPFSEVQMKIYQKGDLLAISR
ncbi:aconitase/3-isopropylmalate dehydratase large subunit family protein [Carboxylicivirga linearis]|uniref:Aconitate hydratase A n=1 Tax=Carboxylicivirga linearis TaxID=1628157 RepID=A0ABS5JX74_9BACT|nr:aconitase/3-isopropylmalate dehydratase large subunit family protein [Carboxylicivirga linearis]MBS2099487.1 3-isopropylmalate dehydratase large subunit [Carboxylicivirga linearis]